MRLAALLNVGLMRRMTQQLDTPECPSRDRISRTARPGGGSRDSAARCNHEAFHVGLQPLFGLIVGEFAARLLKPCAARADIARLIAVTL
jgi:hypothetical protein